MKADTLESIARVQDRHWWYRARRRLLGRLLRRSGAGGRILELGCGPGAMADPLSSRGRVVGLDPDSRALVHAARRRYWALVQASAQDLPFGDGTFDAVAALDVLEHLPHDERACREACRVLRPGGVFLVTVPAFPGLWGLQDEVSGHLRRYTWHQLEDLLLSTGFREVELGYFNAALLPAVALVRAVWRRLRWRSASENEWTPRWLDGPLVALLALEDLVARRFPLPFGVTLYAVGFKSAGRAS